MNNADSYRKDLIGKLLSEGKQTNNRLNLTVNNGIAVYSEILTLKEIQEATDNFKTHNTVSEFLNELVYDRLNEVFGQFNMVINESELDLSSANYYDGYELKIPLIKENHNALTELFDEIDQQLGVKSKLPNKASNTPITKEPTPEKTPNLPTSAKVEKTQNPKKVDLVIKSVFDSKFLNHELKTDAGVFKAVKSLNKDGKLLIVWESVEQPSIMIETLIFPNDSNKILVDVKKRSGEILLHTFFEIYRIPTFDIIAEKFFRKTLFSLLKKYIDTSVIQIDPFNKNFVFWKTDNPNFSYSFSTPNKNKIILDLISFISTAKKPILDDFFEANNLKHKQGYLQTLLDSAEAAGIFRFKREGNEILILRGPNYKAFLEGKVRRVAS